MTQRATVEDILSKKKPLVRVVTVVLDGEIADMWIQVTEDLAKARRDQEFGATPARERALATAEDAYEAAEAEYESAAREMVVRSIGRPAFNKLADKHPATKEQKADVRKQNPGAELRFNPESFPQALLAASLIDPRMTEKQVEKLFSNDAYNDAELNTLIGAALEVNQSNRVVSLGKGSPRILG